VWSFIKKLIVEFYMYRVLQLIITYQIAISLLTWQLFKKKSTFLLKEHALCLRFVFQSSSFGLDFNKTTILSKIQFLCQFHQHGINSNLGHNNFNLSPLSFNIPNLVTCQQSFKTPHMLVVAIDHILYYFAQDVKIHQTN
jgi:hypothetical protein